MRKLTLLVVVFLLTLSYGWAQSQEGGIKLPKDSGLVKYGLLLGNIKVSIYTHNDVGASLLLQDVRRDGTETMDSIYKKVDAVRQSHYAQQEVLMVLEDQGGKLRSAAPNVSIINAIYWWNTYAGYNGYWFAWYSNCTAAALFVDDVSGSWKVFRRTSSGGWSSYATVGTGGAHANTYTGGARERGFKLTGKGAANYADIVMFFYY